jgi:hypothetical protein
LGTNSVPIIFWGGKIRQGRRQNSAEALIPMGDWCALAAQPKN